MAIFAFVQFLDFFHSVKKVSKPSIFCEIICVSKRALVKDVVLHSFLQGKTFCNFVFSFICIIYKGRGDFMGGIFSGENFHRSQFSRGQISWGGGGWGVNFAVGAFIGWTIHTRGEVFSLRAIFWGGRGQYSRGQISGGQFSEGQFSW